MTYNRHASRRDDGPGAYDVWIPSQSGHVEVHDPDAVLLVLDRRETDRRALAQHSTASAREEALALCHDLRQPLGTLSALTQTLRTWMDNDDTRRVLDGIAREVAQLSEFLTTYLAGPAPTAVEAVEVALAVARSVGTGRQRQVQVVGIGAAWVVADRVLLYRALANLVDNACRIASEVVVRVRLEGAWVVLEVADDGPGLSTTVPAQGARGRGLSIARGIATEHGGRLEVGWSNLGGASVALVLPAADEPDPP